MGNALEVGGAGGGGVGGELGFLVQLGLAQAANLPAVSETLAKAGVSTDDFVATTQKLLDSKVPDVDDKSARTLVKLTQHAVGPLPGGEDAAVSALTTFGGTIKPQLTAALKNGLNVPELTRVLQQNLPTLMNQLVSGQQLGGAAAAAALPLLSASKNASRFRLTTNV